MRLQQPMRAELDWNEIARILQYNHSSCKILQDSLFWQESSKNLQDNQWCRLGKFKQIVVARQIGCYCASSYR